jgi:hypothetical protein
MTLSLGQAYVEAGATAYDEQDKDITASVVVSGDTVDVNVIDTYTIIYSATDNNGNTGSATRTVEITT